MMMEENKSKKVLLSVLGVAILIVAVVGISFAAFAMTTTSSTANTVNTGTILMNYSEPVSGISLTNALPMDDSEGIALTAAGQTFQFSVSTTASGELTIPYEISITPVIVTETGSVKALNANQVKVYLAKVVSTVENQVTAPTKIGSLGAAETSGRSTSKQVYKTEHEHDGGDTITTNYVLKMWIAKDVEIGDQAGQLNTAEYTYEYRLLVNVDSVVASLS